MNVLAVVNGADAPPGSFADVVTGRGPYGSRAPSPR